ncbi:MAG: heavy metal translocating P-type ATPase [Salinibacter sp.]
MQHCDHCGLPLSSADVTGTDGAAHYCCHGCRMVAETLDDPADAPLAGEHQALLMRLFAGLLMAGFVMAFSLAISSGYGFEALRQLEHDVGTAHWVLLIPAVPALLLLGLPLLRSAWADLWERRLTLNVLFTLGTTSAVVVSAISYGRGTGPIYLETAVMLLALYTLGRYLTARAKGTTARVLRRLLEVPDTTYPRLRPDPGEVTADALRAGDRIRVRAGDVIPVDGTVVEGRSYVDESSLTGEAQPAVKETSDTVYAGTSALDGALTIVVTAVAEDRRLAQVASMMRRALERPPRIARRTDRILRWLIPSVIVLALVTFAGWWWVAGFSKALYVALSVVLITCPCALGVAIPLSLVVALKQAGREGILLRSGRPLLALAQAQAVVLDKTGTLTTMQSPTVDVRVPETVPAGNKRPEGPTAATLLRRAAAVEQGTRHALAHAIIDAASAEADALPSTSDVVTHPGAGVAGTVHTSEGPRRVGVGNERLVDALGASCPPPLTEAVARERADGRSGLYVIEEGRAVGVLVVDEQIAPHAPAVVSALQEKVGSVTVLTGDHPAAARRLSDRLGVSVEPNVGPSDKANRLAALHAEQGPVAMVGDGINDAAALAEADVGIALSTGASVSMEAADVTLYHPDLRLLPWLHRLAIRTDRVIRQNLWWTFGYNAIGLGLAVAGLLHPLAAVAIMTLSSLLVTGNAYRLQNTSPPDGSPPPAP